jgi:imidazolonepropionase-like amidohydrolase
LLTLVNARIFDGSKALRGMYTVTVKDGCIATVTDQPATSSDGVIDIRGMTLMPGLITSHLHPEFFRFSLAQGQSGERPGKEFPPGVLMAIGVRTCKVLLESGFTGYVGAACAHDIDAQLKIAIAEGIIPGPRIRACSHHIGTTADLNDSTLWWKGYQTPGIDLFADGPEELRKLVREEIRRGAETIKIFASSGRGFTGRTMRNMARDEITTIVNTAHDRGAKVRAHVCDKAMMLECIQLGVDVIDHGDEIDEECIDAMVVAGTFWVPSLTYPKILIELGWDQDGTIRAGYENALAMLPLAQRAGVRILVGDDYCGVFRDILADDPLDHQVGCYGREFALYAGIDGLSAADVLSWGTRNAGELLVDAPAAVGVVRAGAFADLIVVDGDPLEDPAILAQPEKYLKAVIRGGDLVINRLGAPPGGAPTASTL